MRSNFLLDSARRGRRLSNMMKRCAEIAAMFYSQPRFRPFIRLVGQCAAAPGLRYAKVRSLRYAFRITSILFLGVLFADCVAGALLDLGLRVDGPYAEQHSNPSPLGPNRHSAPDDLVGHTSTIGELPNRTSSLIPIDTVQSAVLKKTDLMGGSGLIGQFTTLRLSLDMRWLASALVTQALVLLFSGYLAVSSIRRSLSDLADKAETLEMSDKAVCLDKASPPELFRVAEGMHALVNRLQKKNDERMQILASISHDLKAPVTRMRLRAELAPRFPDREKLLNDLTEVERLLSHGLDYVRSSHMRHEQAVPVDLLSFVSSFACDYQDTGRNVVVHGQINGIFMFKPHAVRRILMNFVENALKFAGAAELRCEHGVGGRLVMSVLDHGPGIPQNKLSDALKPFVRLADNTTDKSEGTGLGLAIAHQLALSTNGLINLKNHPGGGLVAELILDKAGSATVSKSNTEPDVHSAAGNEKANRTLVPT